MEPITTVKSFIFEVPQKTFLANSRYHFPTVGSASFRPKTFGRLAFGRHNDTSLTTANMGSHDTRQNDVQHNDTQDERPISQTQHNTDIMFL
jgi:hypothetical protein